MPLSEEADRAIDRVVDLLRPNQRLLFVTGAGLSADSGLPTYRGVGGLYEGRTTPEGWAIEEVLSGTMLKAKSEVTWTYLNEIADACRGATFNRGHQAIAEMEEHFAGVWTLTQNVDGFHRLSGSKNVIEIHGNMRHLLCTNPRCKWRGGTASFVADSLPPRCPSCNKVIRPDVVLFGEALPRDAVDTLQDQLDAGFDLVFSVGTSSLFPYITEPVMIAHESGIPTVEINPGQTGIADMISIKIPAGAAESLNAIWSRYRARTTAA